MRKIFLLISISITFSVLAQDKCVFYQDKVYGDVLLRNSDRGTGGRVLVPTVGNSVTINFANDFSGGVVFGGWGNRLDALAYFDINESAPIVFNKKMKSSSIYSIGNIGIGIENPKERLEVNGTIRSKEVKIEATGWADFVFNKNYKLPTLQAVEQHIKDKGHLPDIPSENEILENGISVGEIQAKLLQKIEELTLYMIEQDRQNKELKERLSIQETELNNLKKTLK
ncbi:MAG: hypothetical protein LBS20_13310 [Prevotella sp.]|uniref:hypothetical protein n=1 Tax=unclassified Dysgonomonas TaxID=2630389 RepID=UPI0025BB61C9|nr:MULTISPECIES: hypothetical protein [unclassified Dysgonomonas]MDR1716810.1 hypothetical protein [Prevotella sp.]MDR2003783.1 hypothetical protein [Prevotella sp.]HMM03221.1 hypothetical protein [Dysgonomonas sp.]